MAGKRVFATVGTTQFDDLVRAVTDTDTLTALRHKGYTDLVIQIGRGNYEPPQNSSPVKLSYFRLKPSIAEEFAAADLVISHGGAGSCLEALEAGKPLIVVVNNKLMENHQTELAQELASRNLCFYCYPDSLLDTITSLDTAALVPYVAGRPQIVAQHLDQLIKVV